jgi:hypothetical protein
MAGLSFVKLGGSPMAKKPEDGKPHGGTTPENPVVEDVRTKQALDAAKTKRQADAEIDAAGQAGKTAQAPEKVHPKVHKHEDEGPAQDTTGQPVVEDEP